MDRCPDVKIIITRALKVLELKKDDNISVMHPIKEEKTG